MRILPKVLSLALLTSVTVLHAEPQRLGLGIAAQSDRTEQNTVNVSVAHIDADSEKVKAQLAADTASAMRFQAEARKAHDVVKLTCINDRLIRIKAQGNIGDSQNQELHFALERKPSEAPALYAKFVQTGETVHELTKEAVTCLGMTELASESAASEVHGPSIQDDPIANNPFWTASTIKFEPPGYASPYY